MSGLGNFLNPGKLLTKDKKSSAALPAKEKAVGESSSRNIPVEDDPPRSIAAKKNRSIAAGDSDEQITSSSKLRARKFDPYQEVEPTPSPSPYTKSGYNEPYEQERPPQRSNKYVKKFEEEEDDDIRPRPRRSSQRSNSDEDNEGRSGRGAPKRNVTKDPRAEARTRIRELLSQLQNQQQVVKKISDDFNRKLRKMADEQFNKFREAIRFTVEQVISQYEEQFKTVYDREQEATLQGISDVSSRLVELQGRLEEMEEQIDRSNWRNVMKSLDSEQLKIELEDAFVLPKDQLTSVQIRIDEQLLDQFGQALQRLMKIEVVRKKQSRRRPNI